MTSVRSRVGRVLLPSLIVALAVAVRAIPRTDLFTYERVDENVFHHPAILQFASQLPWPDLSNYSSATSPLYHLLLSPLCLFTQDNVVALRIATWFLAMALLVAVTILLTRRTEQPWWGSALLLLPFSSSLYVLGSSIRLSTDNTALLFVVITIILIEVARERLATEGHRWLSLLLWAAVAAAAAAWTRQVHLWLVGLLGLFALLERMPLARRAQVIGYAAIPILSLVPLLLLWGGLTPPSFASHQAGWNFEVIEMELAVLGLFAIPYAPWLARGYGSIRSGALGAAIGVVLTTLVLLAHPLPWVRDDDRIGGTLWKASSQVGDLFGSTAPFWLLMPLGVWAFGAVAVSSYRRRDWLLVAALAGFFAANIPGTRTYQKYYEPYFLLILSWFASRQAAHPRWWWTGPAFLIAGSAAVATLRFLL